MTKIKTDKAIRNQLMKHKPSSCNISKCSLRRTVLFLKHGDISGMAERYICFKDE